MKTLLTPTPLIAVELPENSNRIIKGLNECHLAFYNVESFTVYNIGLDFSILGTVDKGAIDFDCEPYIRKVTLGYWLDYERPNTRHDLMSSTPEDSFISLLKSHSLSLDKKYLIIKPKN